jgi:hypothetical protein
MDLSRRKGLEKFALERLYASADDHHPWSYAWGREGSVCLSYCMWSEHDEFDGRTKGLENVWSKERFDLIEAGDAEPNEDELRQWRDIMCRRAADAGEGVIQSSACRRMARGCGDCATTRLLDHRPFHGGSRRQERLAQPQTRPARTIWRRNILFPMQRSGTRQTLCALVRRRGNGEGDCGWPLPHARCGERIKF